MEGAPISEYTPMIRDLPVDLRPRERIIYTGAGSLSNAELVAIILRMGGRGENVIRMAERLLSQFGGLPGLAQASFDELCHVHGIGTAKAAQIKAALELGRRLLATAPHERPQVRSPADVANLLMLEMGLLEQEHLRAVLLDTKNVVLRVANVYAGNLNTAVV
ncbi:MAG TPA: JAB domain-containing protein, partial [Caldilinea sp.]|nr:JAB domain-containing protein [Caldilinea sp.]